MDTEYDVYDGQTHYVKQKCGATSVITMRGLFNGTKHFKTIITVAVLNKTNYLNAVCFDNFVDAHIFLIELLATLRQK